MNGNKSPKMQEYAPSLVKPLFHDALTTIWQEVSSKWIRRQLRVNRYFKQIWELLAMNACRWRPGERKAICMMFLSPHRFIRFSRSESVFSLSLA